MAADPSLYINNVWYLAFHGSFLKKGKTNASGELVMEIPEQENISDPNLYVNQKETYETVQIHKETQKLVKTLTQSWESLALELEEMKQE